MNPKKTNHETADSVPSPGEYLAGEESADNVDDCLQWLAFCYVADELTTRERADFESRLSTDLEAQEALASVVELGSGIYGNYHREDESTNEPILLDRAGTRNSPSDRSSTLSRMLLIAAAVLVMAVVGYGLSQNSNESTAHNKSDDLFSSPSTSQLSILADYWINSLDGDEIEIADSDALSDWDSEEFDESTPLLDSSKGDDLGLDTNLISFYSEILDSGQEDGLLKSLRQEAGVEL